MLNLSQLPPITENVILFPNIVFRRSPSVRMLLRHPALERMDHLVKHLL